MYIIRFDWLIPLYLFISLVRKAIFLIVKNSFVREEVSDVNKSLCNYIVWLSFHLCTSPLVRVPPQLTLFNSPTTPSTPQHVCSRQFPTLGIWQSPENFTGKRKTKMNIYDYINIAHHLRGQWHSSISLKVLTCHQ